MIYKEHPFQGYPPHATAPPEHAVEMKSSALGTGEVAAALFSSPRPSADRLNVGGHLQDVDDFHSETFPLLPEPISSKGGDSPTSQDARATDGNSIQVNTSHTYTVVRCPECDAVLNWLFVDEVRDGEHHIHKCAVACACPSGTKIREHREPVQVNRGAW